VVMPVLFNRWHDYTLDYGGVYIDQLILERDRRRSLFQPYLESIVGHHATDNCIVSWDLCNEPMLARSASGWTTAHRDAEFGWLEDIYHSCKQLGAKAPLCISTVPQLADSAYALPLSDVIASHLYWHPKKESKAAFETLLDDYVDLANRTNKPLIATETCWGSLDDGERSEIIRYSLGELKKRGIGWHAYLLHASRIADAHGPQDGPVGVPGDLSFIRMDGSLRPGHGVYNDF
jgi:hypothetical protein